MLPDKATTGHVAVPTDPVLVGLAALLDADRMGSAAGERLLGEPTRVRSCRPVYVRYKPGTNCIVAYEMVYYDPQDALETLRFYGKCFTETDYEPACAKVLAKRWMELPGIRPYGKLAGERTLLYAFPNDATLDGLRLLANPKKIQRVLYDHNALEPARQWRISDRRLRLTPVRHKPEKRAVIRVDSRAVHRDTGEKRKFRVYLRTYQDGRGADMFAFMQHLEDHLANAHAIAVPHPIVYLDDRHTLVVGDAAGTTLTQELTRSASTAALAMTGAALAQLHACPPAGLPVRSVSDLLADARDTGRTLAQILPALSDSVTSLLAELDRRSRNLATDAPRLTHGDFHHGQVLVQDRRVVVLDYDRTHAGDPLADVGNFCANLILLGLRRQIAEPEVLNDHFVQAYAAASGTPPDPDSLRFWTALGLLQLSVSPFRSLAPDWPTGIADVVTACRRVLS